MNQDDNGVKAKYGFWVILSGLAVLLITFLYSGWRWPDVKDASTALAAVTGTIGTLVGTYFGFHAGASGKDQAESARTVAEDKVEKLAGLLPRDDAIRVLGIK